MGSTVLCISVSPAEFEAVRGEFSNVSGDVVVDPDAPENSRVEAHIEASSIHTRDEQRDTHLKSADFLDVERYPEITFVF